VQDNSTNYQAIADSFIVARIPDLETAQIGAHFPGEVPEWSTFFAEAWCSEASPVGAVIARYNPAQRHTLPAFKGGL
jgi:hypothetical protein